MSKFTITPVDWDLIGEFEHDKVKKDTGHRDRYVYGTSYDSRITEKQEQAIFDKLSTETKQ